MPAASIPGPLYALRSLAQIEQLEDSSKLPTRLVVLPWGKHQTAKGEFIVNEVTLSALPANQKATNFDRLCLDFEHNSVPGQPTYKGEPVKVAAYGRPVVLSGEGLVLEDLEWTPEGRDYVSGGHYRDLSPAVKTDKDGNVIFLHSSAVCRQGAVPDLILCSADSSTEPTKPTHTKHTTTMSPEKLKALLCAILGLDAEKASDEEIQAAAEKAAEPDPKKEEPKETEKVSDEVASLRADFQTLSASVLADKRAEIIGTATREGKVVPKIAEKLSLDDLRTLCAELPVTVPLSQRTPSNVQTLSAQPGMDAAQQEVNKTLGIAKETFEKHNA